MKYVIQFGTALVAYVATMAPAFAVFSVPPKVPEPGTFGLLLAGGVAILGARYLSKRGGGK